MRKLLLASIFISALLLTGCNADPSTSNWLKYTVWTANPAGKVVEGFRSGTIEEGSVKIKFSASGYIMLYELSLNYDGGLVKGRVSGKTDSQLFPDYSYPDLYFPFPYKGENGQEEMVSSTGLISADLKTIHFDTFTISCSETSGMVIKDLDFTR